MGRYYWSAMSCIRLDTHAPHVWDGDYTLYGPYKCEGHS